MGRKIEILALAAKKSICRFDRGLKMAVHKGVYSRMWGENGSKMTENSILPNRPKIGFRGRFIDFWTSGGSITAQNGPHTASQPPKFRPGVPPNDHKFDQNAVKSPFISRGLAYTPQPRAFQLPGVVEVVSTLRRPPKVPFSPTFHHFTVI